MRENGSRKPALQPEELEVVYSISRAVSLATDIDSALDEIIRLSRPIFIFDNMVLYLQQDSNLIEPAYVRAIGRGRSREAELAWGEATASEVLQLAGVVTRFDDVGGQVKQRTRYRYLLGLPVYIGKDLVGALVFIRFGGPSFEPDQVRLAEFLAGHVAQLLEHKRLVERIVDLEAERRLSRLQEDFIAMVSHELLTPLGFIKGYATTLLRQDTTWNDDTRREFLTIIDEEADRLHELLENLMDSSRLQAGTLRMNFQLLRMDSFLKDITLRAASRHDNIQIQLNLDLPKIKIMGDPTRLAQVFDNLLSNASKYAANSTVMISCEQNGEKVHLSIKDNGPGIPPEHIDHLFKRFYRIPTKDSRTRGTGLGLFICRQIIRAHGGEIGVDSTLGKGAAFHIDLPINLEKVQNDISLREGIQ